MALHPVLRALISDAYQHVFRVLCLELGEQGLSVAVGNEPTNKNQFPAREEASTRLVSGGVEVVGVAW